MPYDYDHPNDHWFTSGCAVKINDEEFVLIGGEDATNARKKVTSYNTVTDSWTTHPELNEGRYNHACAFHPPTNSIIVAGGNLDRNSAMSTTEIIPVDTWIPRKVGDLKQQREKYAMVTVG